VHFFEDNKVAAIALGSAIAGVLVPAMLTFIGLKTAAFFTTLVGNLSAAVDFAYGLAAGMTALATSEEAAAVAAGEFAAASTAAAAGVAAAPFAVAALAIGAIVGVAYALKAAFDSDNTAIKLLDTNVKTLAGESLSKLTSELDRQKVAIEGHAHGLHAGTLAVGDALRKQADYSEVMKEFNDILSKSPAQADRFIAAMEKAGFSTREAKQELRDHTKELKDQASGSDAAVAAENKYADSIDHGSRVLDAANKSISDYAKAADDAAKKTDDFAKSAFALFDAQDAVKDATKTLAEEIGNGKGDLEAQGQDIRKLATAAGEYAVQQLGPGASASAQTAARNDAMRKSLFLLAAQYPQLQGIINAYLLTLDTDIAKTDANTQSKEAALAALDGLEKQYPGLRGQIEALKTSIEKETAATDASNTSKDAAITALDGLETAYPGLRTQIELLKTAIENYNKTPVVEKAPRVDVSQAISAWNLLDLAIQRVHNDSQGRGPARTAAVNSPGGWVGGPVPGQRDQPVPMLLHGGEYILDADTVQAIKQGGTSRGKAATAADATVAGSNAAGDTYIINVNALVADANAGRRVAQALQAHKSAGGKIP
jgi:hypothetical protein